MKGFGSIVSEGVATKKALYAPFEDKNKC